MRRSKSIVLMAVTLTLIVAQGVTLPGLSAEESPAASTSDGVVAFYFHGNTRCATCRKIEAYADEAIHQGFAEALDSSALRWRVVNIEQPDNKHFVEDFQLVTRSVVLAEYREGNVVRWKNLDKVWQLVRDKDGFTSYVQSETREFLGAS